MPGESVPRGRVLLEAHEATFLKPWAVLSIEARREWAENDQLRLSFQRDRDRILHSRAFRRLKHKTQVFVPHIADHQRTRLTHTLEVAQLGRTIARALGLNEDLVEAVALGHDIGHTAFGHTGESVLKEILEGRNEDFLLPPEVTRNAGTFKHNYHSLRVVDLLERRYSRPGLDLSDQVREGILKHTGWRENFPFPILRPQGLRLGLSCHLEGQVVALADEIAQQTHDLEDGLRAGTVSLHDVEKLQISEKIPRHSGEKDWDRFNSLVRGMIALLVTSVIENSSADLERWVSERGIRTRKDFLEHADDLPFAMIAPDRATAELLAELKEFVYRFIINHPSVNRQDWRARKVMSALFKAYWTNPRILPNYVLRRAREELGFPYLRDIGLSVVAQEIKQRYHRSADFARLVADHLAGMSDRFALVEFASLEQPSADQSFSGV